MGLYQLSSKISHRNGRRGVLEPKVRDIRKTIIKLKMELGKQHNSSGYFRVTKEKNNQRKNTTWRYVYSDNGKRKSITSTDINKLEEKVKSKGLEWRKL